MLEDLHTMLVNWLVKHIQHDDRDYAPAIMAYLLEHAHTRISVEPPTRFAEDEAAHATPGTTPAAPPTAQAPAATPAQPAAAQAQAPKRSLWQRIKAFFAQPPSGHA